MRLLILALTLAGCASAQPVPRAGDVVPARMPQADEQCVAQPALDWCRAAARARR